MGLHSFSLLALLCATSINAVAVPGPQPITFPLARIQGRSDLHPALRHQRQVERNIRRLAQLTGRDKPGIEDLGENLHQRASDLKTGNKREGGSLDSRNAHDPIGGPISDKGTGLFEVTISHDPTVPSAVPLHVEGHDAAYLFTVYIGTPARPFLMFADTGSLHMWIQADNCKTFMGKSCGNHQIISSLNSTYFKDDFSDTWTASYLAGKLSGHAVYDNITVAGLGTLYNHKFGAVTSIDDKFNFSKYPFDGIVGLGRAVGTDSPPTIVEHLAAAKIIPEAIASFKLSRVDDLKFNGELMFGALNPDHYVAGTEVVLKNTETRGAWAVVMDSVKVNQHEINNIQNRVVILDTGSSRLGIPAADAAAIHAQITGSQSIIDHPGSYSIPCNTDAVVELTFGGRSFPIASRDLPALTDDGQTCVSGIIGTSATTSDTWMVGDLFLKNVYHSLNYDKNTVTLANLK